MVAIREFIKPPVFDNDDINRQAGQLNAILLSISSLVFLFIVARIVSSSDIYDSSNLILGVLVLAMIGLRYVLHRGYVQAASYSLVILAWVALAYLTWDADGVIDVAYIANIIVILISSLLLGWRVAAVFTLLTIAAGWFFAYAENAGILTTDLDNPLSTIRDLTAVFTISAVLIYLVINSLQQALERARQGEKSLSQLNSELERRVQERTQELSQARNRTEVLLSELADTLRIAHMANYELIIPSQTLVLSDHFFELLGTTAEAAGGHHIPLSQAVEQYVYHEDGSRMLSDIATVGTADMEGDLEYRMVRADGQIRHFAFRFVVDTNDTGAAIRVKGAVQDITERKQSENQLREVENLYRRAIASADAVPYSRYYGDETFVFMGERIYDITGYTPEEMTPALFDSLVQETLMSAEETNHELAVRQARAGQAPQWKADYRLRRRDGGFCWVADTSIELISAEGQSTGSVGILLDITERKQTEAMLAKRAVQLETVTQLATIIASIPDPETMLQTVVDLTKKRFNLYHAHIYVLNELGDTLELTAGADEAGRAMVAQKHSIPLNREQSLVARAARTRQGVVVNDVTQAPDFLPNVLLPDTHAELAAPIIVEDNVLGVLDIQSDRVDAFTEEDVRVQTILAAQIAVALQNARTRKDTERILADLDTYSRRLAKEGWERYFDGKSSENMGFVLADGEIVANSAANGRTKMESDAGVVKPVLIRGEHIGQVMAADVDMDEDETNIIMEAIAQGLGAHLENLRLNEQTELALAESRIRSEELNILNQLGSEMAAALDVEDILKLIYRFTTRLMDATNFYIALSDRTNQETAIYLFYSLEEDESRAAQGDVRSILRRRGGNGVTEYILRSRQPLLISGNMEEKAAQLGFESIGKPSKSWLGVPMVAGNEAIGVIAVQSFDEEDVYEAHHLDLLTAVARQAAGAVENARLIAQTQARARQEQILREITARVYAAPDAESILKTAAQEVSRVLGIETYAYLDEGQTAVKESG